MMLQLIHTILRYPHILTSVYCGRALAHGAVCPLVSLPLPMKLQVVLI
jgi:hypothetical protein